MTLTIAATGQAAEIEEIVTGGYYLRVAGHARYFPTEAVTHPAPTCPTCGSDLLRVYDRLGVYVACNNDACFFTTSAPALFQSA